MKNCSIWQTLLEEAWKKRSIIWLSGVRRAGKTQKLFRPPKFDAKNLQIFRKRYPKGENFVVGYNVGESYQKKYADIIATFVVTIQHFLIKLT